MPTQRTSRRMGRPATVAIAIVLLFGAVGVAYELISRAAILAAASEAEQGIVGGMALPVDDESASGGRSVLFGAAANHKTYTASTAIIPNPEQGFYDYTETHYRADGTGYNPLSQDSLTALRNGTFSRNGLTFGPTALIHRYFYMEKFKQGASLDAAYLALVDADLAAARASGVKAVLRFAYSDNNTGAKPYADAPDAATVVSHIGQLAPVLNKYADVITAVEAGFIGVWGEWYYTDNYTSGTDMNVLSTADWTNRTKVVDELLSKLDSRIFVLVRYVGIKQHIFGLNPTDQRAARVGFHNDAFTASNDDYGTFSTFSTQSVAQNQAYLAAQPPLPMTGESANYNPGPTDWMQASAALSGYHWSSLNPNYYPATLQAWGQTNVNEAARRLGYRLELVSAGVTDSGNDKHTVSITMRNTGYAAPFRNRPVNIVLTSDSTKLTTTIPNVDIRTWKSGSTFTVTATVDSSSITGSAKVYLCFPDPSSNLAANTSYAIQLANEGTWDPAIGNNLGLTVQ